MRGGAMTSHINVRLTPEQRQAIERRAETAGLAPSALMREAALSFGGAPIRREALEELMRARTDLKRVGNNLNQVARALNAGGPDPLYANVARSAASEVGSAARAVALSASRLAGGDGA